MTSTEINGVTPTIQCRYLSTPTQRVWLKLAHMQPTGFFKIRGVQRACAAEAANGTRRLMIASGGNTGIAVAYCARALGLACLVVVPESTRMQVKITLRNLGAEVLACGRTLEDAEAAMGVLRSAFDSHIHPDDNPFILEGYASLIREAKMQTQIRAPDAVVVSVGGGGLMSGVLQGMHFVGWNQVPLIACETFGTHTLALAIAAGHPVEMPLLTSAVSAMSARTVSEAVFAWTSRHKVVSEVVTELEAVRAARSFAEHYNRVIDPSCGAVVAAVEHRRLDEIANAKDVLVVICSGMGTSYQQLINMEEALCRRSLSVVGSASSVPQAYPKYISGMLRRLPPIHAAEQ